ncbi:MAG: DUF4440 domain-containing protein [Minisyncoccia bacterium]
MDIKETIFELENKLLQSDIRKSVENLDDLISEDFIEFGSSGAIYTKKDILERLPNSPEIKFVMTDFKVNVLSTDIVQSTFKTEKIDAETGKNTRSLRSSIWKNESGWWKIIFHQGTLLAN